MENALKPRKTNKRPEQGYKIEPNYQGENVSETIDLRKELLPFVRSKPENEVCNLMDPRAWLLAQYAEQVLGFENPSAGVNYAMDSQNSVNISREADDWVCYLIDRPGDQYSEQTFGWLATSIETFLNNKLGEEQ